MPIRIRFECTRFPHWGAQSGYTQLVRHLDPQRYHPILHAAADSDADLAPWLAPFQQWLRSRIRRGRMPWYKLSDLSAEAEAYASCLAGDVDIVHFLDGEHSGQFLPRLIHEARPPNLRTVATFHQPPEVACELVNGDLLRWFDSIVLVSPSQLDFFKHCVPQDKLRVVLHGVNANFFRPPASQTRSGPVRCITSGQWLRDWETFRKVARAMSDVTFVAVTSSTTKFDGLPNVEAYSDVSDATLAELYRSADILFLPLIGSTANNALLEGIASGLPVVATDLDAVRAYLPNGEGILVAGNRVDSFVDALRALQHDVELRHEKGRRARARAEELDWTRIIHQYEDLYAGLTAAAPVRTAEPARIVISSRALAAPSEGGFESIAAINFVDTTKLPSPAASNQKLAEIDGWGYALLEAGLLEEADALFAALAAVLHDHRGHAGLARIAEERWRWKEAIRHWDKCLAIVRGEEHILLTAHKARCLVQMGEAGQARDLYLSIADRYEGLEGLAQIAALEGSADLAHRRWEECTLRFPDRIDGFLGHAALLLKQGSYAQADALLNHAAGIWPESTIAGALWAWSATLANDKHAGARWKSVLARHPRHRDVCAGYAHYLAAAGNRGATDAYIATLVNDPVALAAFLLEYALVREDWNTAIEQADTLVVLEGYKPWHRLRQAALLMHVPAGGPEAMKGALSILRGLCAHSPESVPIKLSLIEGCIRAGFEQEAESLLQTISAADKGVHLEILRAWSAHHGNGNSAGKELWKTIFLRFGLLHAGNNLFCGGSI